MSHHYLTEEWVVPQLILQCWVQPLNVHLLATAFEAVSDYREVLKEEIQILQYLVLIAVGCELQVSLLVNR